MSKSYVSRAHNANTNLGHLSNQNVLEFLKTCIVLSKSLQKIDDNIKVIFDALSMSDFDPKHDNVENFLDIDEVDDLIDSFKELEDYSIQPVSAFYSFCYSRWDSLNAHVRESLDYYELLMKKTSNTYICPTYRDLKMIKSLCCDLIASFLFIIYYDFDMNEIYEGSKVRDIDEILEDFCKLNDLNPNDFTESVSKLMTTYKLKLAIFEEHPELSDAFEKIMGPLYGNIDEDKLTLDIVKKAISGDLSDSQVYDLTKKDSFEVSSEVSSDANGFNSMNLFK